LNSAVGQARIHCILHGIPLPPIGSFKFNVISEGIQREKVEKVAFARLMAELLGPASGHSKETINLLVATYAEEVFQFRYNCKYTSVKDVIRKQEERAINEDLRIMEKVAAMTVED
jgi:hypothetical protein